MIGAVVSVTGAVTFTITDWLVVPPVPVQERVKVELADVIEIKREDNTIKIENNLF